MLNMHRLQAHNLVRCEVHLVEEQNATSLHRNDHRAIDPNGFAIDETESTEQVIFIGFDGDVHAVQLTLQLRTNLVHHRGLTVTGQTSDEDRVEHT